MYDNSEKSEFFNTQKDAILDALAIGQVLNRTVILPKFHCSNSLCALNNFIYIDRFDKTFQGCYREHSFLIHPKVPTRVIDGKSQLLHIGPTSPTNEAINKTHFVPKNSSGATSEEIHQWFQRMSDIPILHFHSMLNSFSVFTDGNVQNEFDERARKGFKKAKYRQYHE